MRPSFLQKMLLCTLAALMLSACSKSNDQRKFENQALTFPENITEMTVEGKKVENGNDLDDWRIGPMFQGLVDIQSPAYPNPVNLNSSLKIDIDIKGFDSVNGYEIFVFSDPSNIGSPIKTSTQVPLPPGLTTILLDPKQFSKTGSGGQSSKLFRILIYDRRSNLISYGDVMVI